MDELGNYEASKFNDALTELAGAGGNPINVRATVTRRDSEGVVWASVNGKEFPLQGTTVRANPGEIVNVSYDGVSAHASGSYTDPAIGAEAVGNEIRSAVEPVRKIANESGETAEAAAKIAREANEVAKATSQHFWDDDNGAHVTDVTQDEWTAAAADDFSDLSDTKPYHNLLMNSLGILLRRALNNLVSISKSAIAFYDGLGNQAENIVAEFGKNGSRIGVEESPHIEIESNRFSAIGTEGSSVFEVVSSGTVATKAVKFAVSPKTGYEYIARPWAGVGVKEDATNLTTDDYVIVESDEVTLPQLAAGTKIVVRYRVMYFDPLRSGRYVELAQYETIAGTSNQKSLIPPVRQVVFSVGTARSFDVFTVADRSSSEQTFKGIVYNGGTSLKVILPDLQDGGGAQLITVTEIRYYLPTDEASYYSIGTRGDGQVDPAALSTAVGNELISSSQSQAVFGEYNLEDAEDDYALIIGDGTSDSARSNSAVIHKNGGAYISRSMAGFVQMYAGVDLPVGWLWCNGDLVKVSDYPELYEAMGGNKHFNRYDNDIPDGYFRLPDFRGRAPIGVGLGDSSFTHRFLGEEVGAETHTLTGPQSGIQDHSAAVAANWYISTYKGTRSTETVGAIGGSGFEMSQVQSKGGSWSGQNSISIAAKNATQAHNNMQPSLAINFIICTGRTY